MVLQAKSNRMDGSWMDDAAELQSAGAQSALVFPVSSADCRHKCWRT